MEQEEQQEKGTGDQGDKEKKGIMKEEQKGQDAENTDGEA